MGYGYGFGGFLIALGLILALAVQDQVDAVDLTTVGWIITIVGAIVLLLTFLTAMRSRPRTYVEDDRPRDPRY